MAVSRETVVVGANSEDSSTTGIDSTPDEGASGAGAAYVFVRSGTAWIQQAYLKPAAVGTTQAGDGFGVSVAVSGDTAVVGARLEDSNTTGIDSTPDEGASGAGAAYVFVRRGTMWSQQAFLKPTAVGTTRAGYNFGNSVAISGDTVVVGATFEDSSTTGINSTANESATDAGAAYLFVRGGTTWTQQAYLKPSFVGNTQAGDHFGGRVSVSGDTIVVGAFDEDSSTTGIDSTPDESGISAGAAYVFARSGTTWSQQGYLKPAAVGTKYGGDQFGFSVAVSGDTVVVGAIGEDSSTIGINSTPDEGASGAGAAYVFVRSEATWSQQAYLKPAAIGTSQAGNQFGFSVAVSGDAVVVGAYFEDSATTGIDSTPDESANHAGAAYVFARSGTTWSQRAYLKPGAVGTSQANDQFGISVAVSGDTVVVGANFEDSSTTDINSTPDEGASNAGAAYIFTGSGAVVPDADSDGLLDSWELTYWPTIVGHSALDDFDHDGYVELLELALGLNPTVPNPGTLPAVANEGGYLTMTLTKQPGVTYEVQTAGTLLSAQPDSFSSATTTFLINNSTTLKVRDNVLIGTPPARFIRLQVTAAP